MRNTSKVMEKSFPTNFPGREKASAKVEEKNFLASYAYALSLFCSLMWDLMPINIINI